MKKKMVALLTVAVMVVLSVPVAMADNNPPTTPNPTGGCTDGPNCK